MKRLTGSGIHHSSGLKADFAIEYRMGLAGVSYSGTITVEGCPPSLRGGFMAWNRTCIPPGRAVELAMRDSIQFLDVEKLLAMGKVR